MSEHLQIVKAEGYLHLTFSGPFSLAAATATVDAMVAACDREACERVLLDCRPMTGELRTLDRFEVGAYGAQTIPHTIKIALLGRADQLEPDRFFESVTRNRGLMVAEFAEMQEAIEWLRK